MSSSFPPEVAVASPQTPKQEKERLTKIGTQVILEDFTDERRPLSSSCRNLGTASDSLLLKDPAEASAKYFFESLASESPDPLADSGAAVFRYIFRAPGMRTFFETILQAQENNDFGLLKKTEFYYQIYKLAEYLQAHNAEMNAILQKSYNIHHIVKAVGQKPELARESGVVTFCEQMEKTLNESAGFSADVAEKEMLKFFTDVGVDPAWGLIQSIEPRLRQVFQTPKFLLTTLGSLSFLPKTLKILKKEERRAISSSLSQSVLRL